MTLAGVIWAFLIEDGTKLRDSRALCLFWYGRLPAWCVLSNPVCARRNGSLERRGNGRGGRGFGSLSIARCVPWRGPGLKALHPQRLAQMSSSSLDACASGNDHPLRGRQLRIGLRARGEHARGTHPLYPFGSLFCSRSEDRAGTRHGGCLGARHALKRPRPLNPRTGPSPISCRRAPGSLTAGSPGTRSAPRCGARTSLPVRAARSTCAPPLSIATNPRSTHR
jgi:hypothetical protein